MTVNKVNGFAAPYRSATFRAETDALLGRNGILSLSGPITETASEVVIPAFEVAQNGLVMNKTTSTTVAKPLTLQPPYYITVSAISPARIDDLVFQFAKSPFDIAANEVILGEYDGLEWKVPALISAEGIIEDRAKEILDKMEVGPYSGLLTSIAGSNYRNTSGLLFDKRGERIVFEKNALFPIIQADPEVAWRRVDRILYRRPQDSKNRIGVRKLFVGGTYAPTGPKKIHFTQVSSGTQVSDNAKSVIASDNTAHVVYTEGYGNNLSLLYKKYSSDRTSLVTAGTIATNVSSRDFDLAIDNGGNIHIVFANADQIRLLIIDTAGTLINGPINISNLPNPCSNPKVCVDPLSQKVFIAFEYLVGPGNKQIYFTTRSLAGALITPAIRITNTLSSTINPSIDVSDDLVVYLAYEDTNQVWYTVLDDIGQQLKTPVTVSASTGSTSFGTLIHNASMPVIKITDNKELFIVFRQRKNATNYGVSVWTNGSAFLANYLSAAENIRSFHACFCSFDNNLHLILAQAGSVDYVLSKSNQVLLTENLQTSGAKSVHTLRDRFGSMFHTWSNNDAGTFTSVGSPQAVAHIGPIAIGGLINPLVISDTQIAFPSTLAVVPQVGMGISIAGSGVGNNGNSVITEVALRSIDDMNDYYLVTITGDTFSTESPATGVTAQFSQPDGNASNFVKSVSEVDEIRALRTTELASDILLARMSWPGPMILNYIPKSGIGVDSDLFGMYGDIDVDWGATTVGTLSMTNGLRIIDLVKGDIYSAAGGAFPMVDGDALYITMDGANFNITPIVCPIISLPWATPIQVLGFVKNGEFHPHLFSVAGMGQLDVGEEIILGQDLSKAIRVRLGITSETNMAPYPSANIIAPSDPYPTAIGKLDEAVTLFGLAQPQEQTFVVTDDSGPTIFDCTDLEAFSSNHNHVDLTVTVNGRKMSQDRTGGLSEDFRKVGTNQIEFAFGLPKNAKINVRRERTGAPPVGGSTDLTNIAVNPQPITNGSNYLGSVAKGWKALYMKDTQSGQVFELKIVNGVFQIVAVP